MYFVCVDCIKTGKRYIINKQPVQLDGLQSIFIKTYKELRKLHGEHLQISMYGTYCDVYSTDTFSTATTNKTLTAFKLYYQSLFGKTLLEYKFTTIQLREPESTYVSFKDITDIDIEIYQDQNT